MDHERSLTRLLAAIAVTLACLNGCGLSGGAAHADIIFDVRNASSTTVVVRWTGSQSGYASIGHCGGTRQGLDAGDYTIVVGDPPRATFSLHVDKADPPAERTILIRIDGTVVVDANAGASQQPCAGP